MWGVLNDLKSQINSPWIIGGDFNVVHCRSERSSCKGVEKGSWEFNRFINSCKLVDLQLVGMKFTWFGLNNKRSRLDRFLLDEFWLIQFKDLQQIGLKRSISDDTSILLANESVDWGSRPFKFINAWFKDKECVDLIEKEWADMSNGQGNLATKMKKLKGAIKRWHGGKRNCMEERMMDCEERIKELDEISG